MNDDIEALLNEYVDRTEQQTERTPTQVSTDNTSGSDRTGGPAPGGVQLDRPFASEYLDELIIAILFRCDEANGMDIIREFTHRFGIQFSPGTVYPHLHTLEEEGVLACRECVQTKEYRINDTEAVREYLDSVLVQLSCLTQFLDTTIQSVEGPGRSSL